MTQRLNVSIHPFSGRPKGARFPLRQGTTTAQALALHASLSGILAGGVAPGSLQEDIEHAAGSTARPASNKAQREYKWLLRLTRVGSTEVITRELGCADLALLSGGSKFLAIDSGPGLALANAIAGLIDDLGNASDLVLQSMEFVGRDS